MYDERRETRGAAFSSQRAFYTGEACTTILVKDWRSSWKYASNARDKSFWDEATYKNIGPECLQVAFLSLFLLRIKYKSATSFDERSIVRKYIIRITDRKTALSYIFFFFYDHASIPGKENWEKKFVPLTKEFHFVLHRDRKFLQAASKLKRIPFHSISTFLASATLNVR